jgi:hypothetical protein
VGFTDEVASEQQDVYAVLEEVTAGMEDGRRDSVMRKLLVAAGTCAGRRRRVSAGALMAWHTHGGRVHSSAPGGLRHPTSGPGTGRRATDPRAPHVSGFQTFRKTQKSLSTQEK